MFLFAVNRTENLLMDHISWKDARFRFFIDIAVGKGGEEIFLYSYNFRKVYPFELSLIFRRKVTHKRLTQIQRQHQVVGMKIPWKRILLLSMTMKLLMFSFFIKKHLMVCFTFLLFVKYTILYENINLWRDFTAYVFMPGALFILQYPILQYFVKLVFIDRCWREPIFWQPST